MRYRHLLIPALLAVATTACGYDIEQLATREADSPASSKEVARTDVADDQGRTFYEGPVPHQPSNLSRSWSEAVEVVYSNVRLATQDWERGLGLEIALHESVLRNLDLDIRYFLPEAPDTPQFAGGLTVQGGTRPGTSIFWAAGATLPAAVVEPGARLELCGIRRGSLPYDMTEPTVYDCSDFTVGEFRDVASVWQPGLPSEQDPPFDFDQEGGVTLTSGGVEITIGGIAVPDHTSFSKDSYDPYEIPVTATTTNSVPTVLPSIYSTIFTESGRICETATVWQPNVVPSRSPKIFPGETIETSLSFVCDRRSVPDPTRPGEFGTILRPIPKVEQALLIVGTRGLIESDGKLLISITN